VIKTTASFYFVVLTPFLSILAASWLTDAMARNRERGGLLSGATSADDPPGPWDARIAVEVHLTTEGVGRDDLWGNLAGRGRMQLRGVSLRGWNVSASLSEGALQQGVSQWTAGEGEFSVGKNEIALQSFRLTSGNEKTLLRGTLSFARDADLELSAAPLKKNSNARVLRVRGAMAAPRVSLERPQ